MLQRLIRAGSIWAIADQLIASAGNFATMLLVARSLAPSEFGTFVLILTACMVVYGFHANLIVSPLVVLGSNKSTGSARTYLTTALVLTLALLPVSGLVVFAACLSLHRGITGTLAVLYILAWQLQETTRRSLLSRLRFRDAIWGDSISYLGQVLILGFLTTRRRISLDEVFVVMAATSLAGLIVQAWQGRAACATRARLDLCATEFWDLGKWMVVASLASLATGPIFPWLLNWFHGPQTVASYQAAMNVLGVANPIIVSIPTIVMPAAALFIGNKVEPARPLLKLAAKYTMQFEAILSPWFFILLFWPHNALVWFYGRTSAYACQTISVRIGILVYVLTVPMIVLGAVLTGSGRTKRNAAMQASGAVASILTGPPLIFAGGAIGAMLAEALSRGVRVFLAIRMLYRPAAPASIEAS